MSAHNDTRHILVVGRDPALRDEFESALGGLRQISVVTHYVADERQGIEIARSRRPDLVCVDFERDLRALKRFAEEIAISAPGVSVAALYRRDALGGDDSEGALIIEAFRAKVQDLLRRPLSSAELGQLFERLFQRAGPRSETLGRVVSVVSNKGGVGKSTMSVSIACSLANRHPDRVLLVDASLQLGVCAPMLDLEPETTLIDAVRQRDRLDETLIRRLSARHASGLHLLAAPRDAVEAGEVDEHGISNVISMARRAFDYVIVDTFPLLDGIVTAVFDLSDVTYVVLQGTVPSVLGGARFLEIIAGLGVPQSRIKVVLNHNYPNFSGSLKPAQIAEQWGRVIDHVMPYQKRLMEALNSGQPYALRASALFGFGRALKTLVQEIETIRHSDAPVDRAAEGTVRDRTEPITGASGSMLGQGAEA
jgi:pilus assembly protein CpaE